MAIEGERANMYSAFLKWPQISSMEKSTFEPIWENGLKTTCYEQNFLFESQEFCVSCFLHVVVTTIIKFTCYTNLKNSLFNEVFQIFP